MITRHSIHAVLVASLALTLSSVAYGLDTDVYLKPPTIFRDDAPNILIILDNSGSMESNSITTWDPYDPTVTYSGSYDTNYVYWSTNTSIPNTSTSNKFPVTNNRCTASKTNLGSGVGATGIYASENIVGWIWSTTTSRRTTTTSTTQGYWGNLAGGNNQDGKAKMADVECAGDNPAETGYLYLDNTSPLAYTSRYTNTAANAVTWSNFSKPTLYSANYLNYRANPSNSSSQTRMQIAKDAVKSIIDSNTSVRLGIMVFNRNNTTPHGGRMLYKVQSIADAAVRTSMKATVDSIRGYADAALTQQNYTPLSETMWEAYRYMSGQSVKYGNPSPAQVPAQDLCAQDATNTPCTATGTYVTPFTQACQKSYIIIVTDGDPTNDDNADTLISGLSGMGTNNNNGSRLDELAEWMNTHDLVSNLTGNQVVVTYTVGFGSGISTSGLQLLKDTARRGGNAGKLPEEGYYTANDSLELTNAIQSAIIDALQVTTSFTAPALSVNAFNTLYNRDEVYFAMFKPSTRVGWYGNIKKYTLCKDTSSSPSCNFGEILDANGKPAVDITTLRISDTATSIWSGTVDGNAVDRGGAGSRLPAYNSRKVYTYTGGYDADGIKPAGGNPVDLTAAAHVVSTSNAALTDAMLGVATADRDDLINWIRGQDVYDADNDTVEAEDRGWRFYDPIHSRPVLVNYGGTSTDPILKIFVGTNDGMMHMINEKTGEEEWAFLPRELLAGQQDLANNDEAAHTWGVDGTPSFDILDHSKDANGNTVNVPDGIIDPSIGDRVHMYFGMRRGGKNIYALDVTPTVKLTTPSATGGVNPKLMWVIRGGTSTGYGALGQTWSRPIVRTMRMGTGVGSGATAGTKYANGLFFAGGYDPQNDINIPGPTTALGNAVYIADPATGQLIWWASDSTSGADLKLVGMNYSIPSDLNVLDTNGDGAVDRVYVGDVGGQVWRIDLSPTLMVGQNAGSSGHILADLACTSGSRSACAGTTDQDRRRFFYPPSVAQVEDSIYGSPSNPKYDVVTIASGDREDPLDYLTQNKTGTPVHNRIYVLRDYNISAMATGGSITYQSTIKDSSLYDATSNALQSATTATITASGIQGKMGWFIDLKDSTGAWIGEKSLARTDIFAGTLYVTTFTPANASSANNTCSANEGQGSLYALNILNGAASVDLTGNGVLDGSDRKTDVSGGIPSEQVVIIRPGGSSTLVGTVAGRSVPPQNRWKTYWFQ